MPDLPQGYRPGLPDKAAFALTSTMAATVAATCIVTAAGDTSATPIVTAMLVWAVVGVLIVRGLTRSAPLSSYFGLANTVTTIRAGATVLLAAFVPVADQIGSGIFWVLSIIAIVALLMDGLDGYLARSRNESTAFGARFDMEVDALLALVMSLLLWRSQQFGIWILGLGVLRYLFVAAGLYFPALQQPLFPSMRRKTVCVIQVATLAALLTPLINGTLATLLGVSALLCLIASFARDTQWLMRRQPGN